MLLTITPATAASQSAGDVCPWPFQPSVFAARNATNINVAFTALDTIARSSAAAAAWAPVISSGWTAAAVWMAWLRSSDVTVMDITIGEHTFDHKEQPETT